MTISRTTSSLGIDIGVSSLKIALLSRERAGPLRLVECVVEPYETPFGSSGLDPAGIASGLRKALKKISGLPRGMRTGLAITGQAAFVRLVKIPATDPQKVRRIIHFEIQQQIPFPVRDVVWDFHICGRQQQQLSVLVAAVKKEMIMPVVELAASAGLDIECVDVSSLALLNCLAHYCQDLNRALIVDIGSRTTNLIAVQADSIWTRSIPVGGDDMTAAISRQTGMAADVAEELKRRRGSMLLLTPGSDVVSSQDRLISDALSSAAADLNNEIAKTLAYYRSQDARPEEFRRVLLTGGVSRMEKMPAWLGRVLPAPVETVNFFDVVEYNPKIDRAVNAVVGPALGVALRGLDIAAVAMNVLPRDQKQIRKFRQRQAGILAGAACLALTCCCWAAVEWYRWDCSVRYVRHVRMLAQRFETSKDIWAAFHRDRRRLRQHSAGMAALLSQRRRTIAVWDALANALPSGLWLTSLEFSAPAAELKIQGAGTEPMRTVAALQERLQQDSLFREVKVDRLGNDEDGRLLFSLAAVIQSGQEDPPRSASSPGGADEREPAPDDRDI